MQCHCLKKLYRWRHEANIVALALLKDVAGSAHAHAEGGRIVEPFFHFSDFVSIRAVTRKGALLPREVLLLEPDGRQRGRHDVDRARVQL